ncbi:MAG: cohesin domain-containing protein, partial [Bacteroidota bacterium]
NSVTLNATTDPSNTIQWRRNGTDIAGATNNTLTASDAGAYTARVTSSTGCAATSNAVQVTVRPNSASTVSASICQGQSYSFGSQSLTSAGTYNRTVTSANGCDSVITLNLTVNPTYNSSIQASILFGNTYSLGSQNLTSSGTYTEVFQSTKGCDSIVNLTLTVIPPTVNIGSATICAGDTVTVPVEVLNGNAIGAISLAINYNNSNLTYVGATQINPAVSSSIIVNAGVFNGQSQIRAGWFDINSISINGLLFNLQFIASASSSLNFDLITPDICEIADENALAIPGTTFNNGSVSVLPTPTRIITETIQSGTSITICGNTFNSTGTYTIICPNGATNGCDSVITLNLTVNTSPPSTTIGSVSGCVGDTVLVPVTIQNGFGIASISMAIGYDPSKLACTNGVANVNSAIANSLLTNCGTFNGVSQFRAAWFDLNPVNLNGNLFTMKFVVLAPGTHALSWDLATPGNCEYTDAAADVIPGTSWNNGNVTLGSGCCSVFASITPAGSTSICQGSSVTLNATSGTGLS